MKNMHALHSAGKKNIVKTLQKPKFNKLECLNQSSKLERSSNRTDRAAYIVVDVPNDLTIVLTLSAKAREVILFPGTWKGFDTASTYAA